MIHSLSHSPLCSFPFLALFSTSKMTKKTQVEHLTFKMTFFFFLLLHFERLCRQLRGPLETNVMPLISLSLSCSLLTTSVPSHSLANQQQQQQRMIIAAGPFPSSSLSLFKQRSACLTAAELPHSLLFLPLLLLLLFPAYPSEHALYGGHVKNSVFSVAADRPIC